MRIHMVTENASIRNLLTGKSACDCMTKIRRIYNHIVCLKLPGATRSFDKLEVYAETREMDELRHFPVSSNELSNLTVPYRHREPCSKNCMH